MTLKSSELVDVLLKAVFGEKKCSGKQNNTKLALFESKTCCRSFGSSQKGKMFQQNGRHLCLEYVIDYIKYLNVN